MMGYFLFVLFLLISICIRADSDHKIDSFIYIKEYVSIAVDTYFFVDVMLRFVTGYVDCTTGEIVDSPRSIVYNYFKTWFIFDVLTIIPYATVWKIWRARPALRLLDIHNSPKPILSFLKHRKFRQNVFHTIKEFFAEKKWIEKSLGIKTIRRSIFRKALRFITGRYRILDRLENLSILSNCFSQLGNVIVAIRGLSLLSNLLKQFNIFPFTLQQQSI